MTRNILTLDIEDWYQSSVDILGPEHASVRRPISPTICVVANTRRLLSILAEHGVLATCFVLGSVAESFPDLVEQIHCAGHEIATHGYGHELVYNLMPEQFRADLQRSIELLERITGEPVRGYRAPYFSITRRSEWAFEILAEQGIEYDSSIFPIRRGLYGFPGWDGLPHWVQTPRRPVFELPISTLSILGQNLPFCGGGYFRLLPYGLVREAVQATNRLGQPAVFYLHPYELDSEELSHPLPGETRKTRWVRFTQGLNREKTESKLRRLLADFDWTSVRAWMEGHRVDAQEHGMPGISCGLDMTTPSRRASGVRT